MFEFNQVFQCLIPRCVDDSSIIFVAAWNANKFLRRNGITWQGVLNFHVLSNAYMMDVLEPIRCCLGFELPRQRHTKPDGNRWWKDGHETKWNSMAFFWPNNWSFCRQAQGVHQRDVISAVQRPSTNWYNDNDSQHCRIPPLMSRQSNQEI